MLKLNTAFEAKKGSLFSQVEDMMSARTSEQSYPYPLFLFYPLPPFNPFPTFSVPPLLTLPLSSLSPLSLLTLPL